MSRQCGALTFLLMDRALSCGKGVSALIEQGYSLFTTALVPEH
jgi:hypothetical protein